VNRAKVKRVCGLLLGLSPWLATGDAVVLAQTNGNATPGPVSLSRHLSQIGARIYGSWTCPACRYQLNLFGPEASADIPYVECNKPEQYPDQAQICRKADLRVYPTWELSDGSRLEGVQSLDTLRRWSGLN